MKIEIQNKFKAEKEYLLQVLLGDLLGLTYSISYSEEPVYRFILNNGRTLVVEDHFFSKLDENEFSYKEEMIPTNVFKVNQKAVNQNDLVVLFGNEKFESGEDVVLGFDLMASAFFMLTRWEEIANKTRDVYDRFPDSEALCIKKKFYDRPVVNEYAECLWNWFASLGIDQEKIKHKFRVVVTHDIDELYRYKSLFDYVRTIGGDLLVRRRLKSLNLTLKDLTNIKFKGGPDSYHTFDFLMKASEKRGMQSRFYFIPGHLGEEDVRYDIRDPLIPGIIQDLQDRGHEVGYHASYGTHRNPEQFREELERLSKLGVNPVGGRQHYLRLSNPATFRMWEENNMQYDSTLGFSSVAGFRTGTCHPHKIFDLEQRKTLKLIERPVLVMDVGIRRECPTPELFLKKMEVLADRVKQYQGEFVMIWHNSNLNTYHWNEDWKKAYLTSLDYLTTG